MSLVGKVQPVGGIEERGILYGLVKPLAVFVGETGRKVALEFQVHNIALYAGHVVVRAVVVVIEPCLKLQLRTQRRLLFAAVLGIKPAARWREE